MSPVPDPEPFIHPIDWASAVDTSDMKRVGPPVPDPRTAEEPLRAALEWAMAPNPRYEGRHRTEPRCRTFMPTDGRCDCGYEQASAALAAEPAPAPLDVERLTIALAASLDPTAYSHRNDNGETVGRWAIEWRKALRWASRFTEEQAAEYDRLATPPEPET